jgi:predicted 3-demethylubiquinone-9 3-methyltransferase (glyoxalase superfamily)
MQISSRISPCLWFDSQAEEAARFYIGIFKNSRVVFISRYGKAGREIHGRPPGSVMAVSFLLDGEPFTALNGGPVFKFNEAISFQVRCDTQEEIDDFWDKLGEGGDETARQCGWLKDKFGVSWQVIPRAIDQMMSSEEPERSERVMAALLKMKKLDLEQLQRAYRGQAV